MDAVADLNMQKQADQKIESGVQNAYEEFVKKEQDELNERMKLEAAQRFDETRKLGFATRKEVEERVDTQVKAVVAPILAEMEKMRKENTELREMVFRNRARGQNSGATDDGNAPRESPYQRAFMKDWKK